MFRRHFEMRIEAVDILCLNSFRLVASSLDSVATDVVDSEGETMCCPSSFMICE